MSDELEQNKEDGIFGDLTPLIYKMADSLLPFEEASERVIGYIVLKNKRRAEITIKLNTCEEEWLK